MIDQFDPVSLLPNVGPLYGVTDKGYKYSHSNLLWIGDTRSRTQVPSHSNLLWIRNTRSRTQVLSHSNLLWIRNTRSRTQVLSHSNLLWIRNTRSRTQVLSHNDLLWIGNTRSQTRFFQCTCLIILQNLTGRMYWSVIHNTISRQCFNSVEACYFGPFFIYKIN